MTDDIRKLHEAATPAPWYVRTKVDESGDYPLPLHDILHDCIFNGENMGPEAVSYHDGGLMKGTDAAFIVALRNAFASGDLIPRKEHEAALEEARETAKVGRCVECAKYDQRRCPLGCAEKSGGSVYEFDFCSRFEPKEAGR